MGRIGNKEFFMKIMKNLLFTGFALLAINFASCKNDPATDGFLDSLENLDTSKSTGLDRITVTNAVLEGDTKGVTINLEATGGTFTVRDGKLNMEITGEPSSVYGKDDQQFDTVKEILLGTAKAGYDGTFDPDDTKFRIPSFYGRDTNGRGYLVYRYEEETDMETYAHSSLIYYVYVDKDCRITSDLKSDKGTYDGGNLEGQEFDITYNAIDLQLKKGWNLIQHNRNMTVPETIITVKIADKNIPWYIKQEGQQPVD
jgi:hypothetical protein